MEDVLKKFPVRTRLIHDKSVLALTGTSVSCCWLAEKNVFGAQYIQESVQHCLLLLSNHIEKNAWYENTSVLDWPSETGQAFSSTVFNLFFVQNVPSILAAAGPFQFFGFFDVAFCCHTCSLFYLSLHTLFKM